MSVSGVLGFILFVCFVVIVCEDWSHGAKGVYEKMMYGEFKAENCVPAPVTVGKEQTNSKK